MDVQCCKVNNCYLSGHGTQQCNEVVQEAKYHLMISPSSPPSLNLKTLVTLRADEPRVILPGKPALEGYQQVHQTTEELATPLRPTDKNSQLER